MRKNDEPKNLNAKDPHQIFPNQSDPKEIQIRYHRLQYSGGYEKMDTDTDPYNFLPGAPFFHPIFTTGQIFSLGL